MIDRHRRATVVVGALVLVIVGTTAAVWARQSPADSNAPGLAAAAGTHSTTLPGRWKRTFDDEFKGHRLNQHKWQPGWFGTGITKPGTSNDRECYSSKQVKVAHGKLHLRAVAKPTRCGGVAYRYRSGIVSTDPAALGYGKGYQFKYGVIEFRVKIPGDGRGHCANWTTLWTNGQQWPTDGEMDIFECLRSEASWYVHSDVPGGAYSVPGGSPPGHWVGWHTFAIDWEPNSVTAYFDGKRVGSHVYKVPHPNYIVINNAIRKGSPAVVPADVKVDYVRVWRHSTAPGAVRLTLSAK